MNKRLAKIILAIERRHFDIGQILAVFFCLDLVGLDLKPVCSKPNHSLVSVKKRK
jgi:hypothetical protein